MLTFSLLLTAGASFAQESYTLSATAGQVNNFVEPGRVTRNEQLCNRAGLALNCTTAQLQAVSGFESEVIYPDSQVGRESFVTNDVCLPQVSELKNVQKRWDKEKARLAWDALNRTGKDAVCSALSLPNGCELY